jgi:aminomethyltransferase
MQVGQCKYVILVNQHGGVLNDPILLRVEEDTYWFSLADSDILLWAQGLAANTKYDIEISEPDVSPLQLQGPYSRDIMVKIFGDEILELKYYWFKKFNHNGNELVISRTGWSSELGYEIFLMDSSYGNNLYNTIMEIGYPVGLRPGHTSTIRRIEGGMLSYHADMTIHTNPLELGMGKFINLDKDFDFIGKDALLKIAKKGLSRKQVGIIIEGKPMNGPNTRFWDVIKDDIVIGKVTSAVYSPRLKQNIGLALIDIRYSDIGEKLKVDNGLDLLDSMVVEKPFYDPNKNLTKS